MYIKSKRGITLIVLVITIIVLLILAGISLTIALGDNGVINKADNAKTTSNYETEKESIRLSYIKYEDYKDSESDYELDVPGAVTTGNEDDGWKIVFDDTTANQYILLADGTISDPFNKVEWDKNAASEDCFIWKSDDPTSEDYGTIMGYTPKINNYTKLKYPSRCNKILLGTEEDFGSYDLAIQTRSYTRNIKQIELPDTIKTLGKGAFSGDAFVSLEEIKLPNSIASIGQEAFRGCTSLTSIEIPNNVTSIEELAFDQCNNLSRIQMHNNITFVGTRAFNGTAWYNNKPNGVIYVGKVLYKYKGDMPENTSIEIKNGTTCITGEAFSGCRNLISIELPVSLTQIGSMAFSGCTGVSSIIIPNSVTAMSEYVFNNWTSSQTIKIRAASKPAGWKNFWDKYYNSNEEMAANIVWGYTGN